MRFIGLIARIGGIGDVLILIGKLSETSWEKRCVDGKIILKWNFGRVSNVKWIPPTQDKMQ
jgi:hypothetical protein